MNCEQYQSRLLRALDPDDPPDDVAAHLGDCPVCRAWQRQLLRIERHVPLLPVPASQTKEDFLARLETEREVVAFPTLRRPARRFSRNRVLMGIGGVAAAIALLLLGGWAMRYFDKGEKLQAKTPHENAGSIPVIPSPRQRPTELIDRLMACDLRLAEAATPRQRVQTLADLEDALRAEAKILGQVNAPEALQSVVLLYGKVVQQGIITCARGLPSGERREVLTPIVERLAKVEEDVEGVARNAGPTTAERLRQVALLARQGDAQLRALVQGGRP
jgi:hypothetical protein